jgi:tRNA1Val (adenine37-N6)-methyltransferase
VEIDENAVVDARRNFEASSWSGRLQLIHSPIQDLNHRQKYDLIISNPPFFNHSLKSEVSSINKARHDDTLSQDELLQVLVRHLSEDGNCSILYPEREMNAFVSLGKKYGLYLNKRLTIYNQGQSSVFRVIGLFSKVEKPCIIEELYIRNSSKDYTPEFINLLKKYYLYL